jgi:2-polyprenyl-6-methoxyphenol hydroxylase-like FAD-dependent oxidoreductase
LGKSGRIVIAGGSVGGLAAALALKNSGREVVIVERDPAPPEIAPEQAFDVWERAGVAQFRHAHILLARLQTEIRDHHPELLAELTQAGITLSALDEMLPPTQLGRVPPDPSDGDLSHLWGRRATFEYVLRRHVGRLPHVRFEHGVQVAGLLSESSPGALRVTGLELSRGDVRESLHGDVVIDASGARSKAPEWLEALGVKVTTELHASQYAYFCRHYRLRDASSSPPRRGTGANLDYLWYGLFCAEHGHFSIALACPTDEAELIARLKRPEGFDAACRELPLLAPWTSASELHGKVLGAGKLANRWIKYGGKHGDQGGPELLGFLPLGDAHLHTNPMYGRGCSSAFIQAHVLAEALAASDDPREQARHYHARTWELIRPHFESAVHADRMFLSRASQERGAPVPLGFRVLNWLYDRVWMPALLDSPLIAREMIKAMEMRELSGPWTRLRVIGEIFRAVALRLLGRPVPTLPAFGPRRGELLRALPSPNDE